MTVLVLKGVGISSNSFSSFFLPSLLYQGSGEILMCYSLSCLVFVIEDEFIKVIDPLISPLLFCCYIYSW